MSQVTELIARFNRTKTERDGNWNTLLQDCFDYVLPRKNNITYTQKGERKDTKIYNSTAIRCNEKHASGIFSYSCPPDKRWFALRAKNNELQKLDSVKRWFGEVTQILFEEYANSNFNAALHEAFLDLGIGTCCISQMEGRTNLFNFSALHISEYYYLESEEGIVDTVFRAFKLTARQAVAKFTEEKLDSEIVKAANNDRQMEQEFDFLHAVYPRLERDEEKLDALNMPFCSMYIDIKHQKLISESGYNELPYHVCRYSKSSSETMGRGPAMNCLAEIKTVNKMDEDILLATELKVKPPWTAPDDESSDLVIDNSPGGITYYKPNTLGALPAPVNMGSDIGIGREEVDRKEQFIYRAFANDVFEILGDKKQMTATEVIQRVEDQLITLIHALSRIQSELFSPMLNRSFGIGMRMGMFPPPPQELMIDPEYEVEYVSKMALAIKMLENRSLGETMNMLMGFIELDPSVMDNLNMDKIVQGVSSNNGMPVEWIRSEDEVTSMRAARAAAAQKAQQAQQIEQLANAVPKLQGATQPGSPLAQLTGN